MNIEKFQKRDSLYLQKYVEWNYDADLWYELIYIKRCWLNYVFCKRLINMEIIIIK